MATAVKPRRTRRTKPRVESTEPAGRVPKSAAHRSVNGKATVLDTGVIEISSQISELVPVAQYANVTIGPVMLRWSVINPGIEKLGAVNWDEDELTAEQQAVYDEVRGYIRATSKLIEHSIAEDREIVEESVRLHNEREAEKEAADKKKSRSSRR
jgi:hypothetical protein